MSLVYFNFKILNYTCKKQKGDMCCEEIRAGLSGRPHFIYVFHKKKIFFSFLVEYICVSFPVILFITGEAAPAALPAHA